jgi:hypothetical protein
MLQNRVVWAALLLAGVFQQPGTLAEERVARIGFDPGDVAAVIGGEPAIRARDLERVSFVVYTKQEVDAKEVQAAKAVRELQAMLSGVQQNVRALSEVNDALTKRVDDLEMKMAQNK